MFFFFFWTICYTFHNQTMLKFYFNTMTKTRFTLKYSRIHSVQACSSKVEWGKKKSKISIQRAGFSLLPPPIPLKVSVFFFPPLGFQSRKSCLMTPDSRLVFFVFFSLLFLQMLPKWTEGWCYFTSTDFQKKTLIPWSTHALPLKSRFWAQKEIVCIYFIWLSTKKGMFGVKMCVHQDKPQLYNLLCFIQQSLRVLQKEGWGRLGSRSFSQIQAGGR